MLEFANCTQICDTIRRFFVYIYGIPSKKVIHKYKYLDNEYINFVKPMEMFVPGAQRKHRNKNRVKQSSMMFLYYPSKYIY